MKWKLLFQSRKFWSSLIGLVIAVGAVYGVDIPQEKLTALLQSLAIIVAGYNVGTGIESGLSTRKNRTVISDFERRWDTEKTGRQFEIRTREPGA
ncbi:MAG: hypothetical protein R3A44_44310 [Caldilineaceae bacterium]